MTTEEKELIEELLTHQLEDIMFHVDMMQNYALLNDYSNMECVHKCKFLETNKCFAKMSLHIIHQYNEIISPLNINRVIIFDDESEDDTNEDTLANQILNITKTVEHETHNYLLATAPTTVLERKEMHKHLLQVWEKWEETKIAFLEHALEAMPKHILIMTMLKHANCNLKAVQYCLKKI